MLPCPIFSIRQQAKYKDRDECAFDWGCILQNKNPHALFLAKQYFSQMVRELNRTSPNFVGDYDDPYPVLALFYLSTNPMAFAFFKEKIMDCPEKAVSFASNPNAIKFILKNIDTLSKIPTFGTFLSKNENAGVIINTDNVYLPMDTRPRDFSTTIHTEEKSSRKLKFSIYKFGAEYLSMNPNPEIVKVLFKYKFNIYWPSFCKNTHPDAIQYLHEIARKNPNDTKLNWPELSGNPSAIDLLTVFQDNIVWDELSLNVNAYDLIVANIAKTNMVALLANKNPKICNIAVDFMLKNYKPSELLDLILFKTHTEYVFENPNAMPIIKHIIPIISGIHNYKTYKLIVSSPHPEALNFIYTWDFKEMKEKNAEFAEELAQYVFNPMRMSRVSQILGIEFEEYANAI